MSQKMQTELYIREIGLLTSPLREKGVKLG